MTHYENATSNLKAYHSAVDRQSRNTDYENALLSVALIEAVLDICVSLDRLVSDKGIVYMRDADRV